MKFRIAVSALFLFIAIAIAAYAAPVRAAESYDSCAGTIASLPAVITSQGVWCMKQDLAMTLASGKAISIEANNVTIDCNGFKLGGLAGGTGTNAIGIAATNRTALTIRNCNIRGFRTGVHFVGDGVGHIVEDNRFEANTVHGVNIAGDGSVVRRNLVLDTGGSSSDTVATLMSGVSVFGDVDVIDNTIRNVVGRPGASAAGIQHNAGVAASIDGNRVSGVMQGAGGADTIAIWVTTTTNIIVRGNDVTNGFDYTAYAIQCATGGVHGVARDNATHGFNGHWLNCGDGGGNSATPEF